MSVVVLNWIAAPLIIATLALLVWIFLRALLRREGPSPVTPALLLLTAAIVCGLLLTNLGEVAPVAAMALAFLQLVLLGLAMWKLWPVLLRHLREVGLMKEKP
jgi:hypothetical protein